MIKITITTQDKQFKRFTVSGHAEYDVPGKDIVCSAVSILVINTVNSLDAFTESACEIETDDDMGYINCYIKNPTADSELLMKSLVLGLEGIKDSYGEYVEIYYKEV